MRTSRRVQLLGLSATTLFGATACRDGAPGEAEVPRPTAPTVRVARALVRLGTIPGRVVVRIAVPEYGLRDSAAYVVRPGAAVRVALRVNEDRFIGATNLAVGGAMTLTTRVLDRYRNVRTDPLAFAVSGADARSAEIDPTSGRATAREFGQPWAVVRSGGLVDSVQLRVVPPGRLLMAPSLASANAAYRLLNTDGSARLDVPASFPEPIVSPARFDPGKFLVLATNRFYFSGVEPGTIYVVDTLGVVHRRVASAEFGSIVAARRLADGTIVAVSHRVQTPRWAAGTSVFRISPTDTLTLVRTVPGFVDRFGTTDISPDGRRITHLASVSPTESRLAILDLATGISTPLESRATVARWSPDGDRVAYFVDDRSVTQSNLYGLRTLVVVNADGSGRRAVGARGFLHRWIVWSPDGQFLAAYTSQGAVGYVRLSDGLEVSAWYPIPSAPYFTEDFSLYDWR